MRPRLLAASGLIALAVLSSACGGGSSSGSSSSTPAPSQAPSTTPSATASPTGATASGADLARTCARKPLHLRTPAAAAFGNANLTTAYCSMVAFTAQQGTSNLAAARDRHTVAEFAFVRPYLTRSARKYWDSEVRKGVARESVVGWQNVAGLSLVDLTVFGRFTPPASGSVCSRPQFTALQTAVFQRGGTKELGLRFTMRCDLSLVRATDPSGARYQVPFVNDREFTLAATPSSAHPWLIDGWVGHFRFAGRPTPAG